MDVNYMWDILVFISIVPCFVLPDWGFECTDRPIIHFITFLMLFLNDFILWRKLRFV